MTVKECLEAISFTDAQYINKEDKNYYLVHKIMELIALVKDEDMEELKDEIIKQYSYHTYSTFREYVCVMSKEDVLSNENHSEDTLSGKEEITNIINFYDSYDENLIRYIKGHLFLEFAMNTIISKALNVNTEKKTFDNKIELLFKYALVSEKEKKLLKVLNKIRNEIAHNLNYALTFDTLYNLVKLSVEAGVEYSDSTIYDNKKLSKEWYGMEGIINELFPNTFSHLFYENEQYFENSEFLKYMT